MKIVYCIAGTYNAGGMERVLANKANAWVKAGHEVIIVTTDQRGQRPFFNLDARIRQFDLGINYEVNNGKSFLNKLCHYPFKQWKHRRRLSALLTDLRADIVVSMFCNEVSILPGIQDGSKKVLEVHFSRFKRLQYGRKGLWKLADEWRSRNDLKCALRYDCFVVLTQEDQAYWGELPHIRVIPNARSYTFEAPALLENPVVLAVGRYDYQKGFERLIEAWKRVCKQVDGWTLQIVGDGPLRTQMCQQIQEAGLQQRVQLKKLSSEAMKKAYSEASILVMSSRYEGLPMVLLEGQAAGLPIVSFACKCGPRDLIHDGIQGFLVEEGDVEGLATRLLQLIHDKVLRKRMGAAAFQNSVRYSDDCIMKQWDSLFHELIE